MLIRLLENIKDCRRECIIILAVVCAITYFTFTAQSKGTEKAIACKIERWEKQNYHLTEYRKDLIRKACIEDFDNADEIINRLGSMQKNFDR